MSEHLHPPVLSHDRFEALTAALHAVIRAHYEDSPPSREKVFEALNALASVAAVTIVATQADAAELRAWFVSAVDASIADFEAQIAARRTAS